MALELRVADGGPPIRLAAFRLVIAGYTGRDAEAVEAHIRELAAHGVPPPDAFPTFYDLSADLLRRAPTRLATGPSTSGEAEPVLVRVEAGTLYVGIGSDHTDREVERESILESKRACPKVMAEELWRFDDVVSEWDALELSSTVSGNPYQRGTLAALRRPEELLTLLPAEGETGSPLVLFLGTIPLLDGSFCFNGAFEASLADPRGRVLACSYAY